MHTFNGYCKTVIRFAAINAWRDRSRRRQKEISLSYPTEEKFYPLGTTDEYFEAPYEEYPVTICGQKVILTMGSLPQPCYLCRRETKKSFSFTFSGITHSGKSEFAKGVFSMKKAAIKAKGFRFVYWYGDKYIKNCKIKTFV